jgi:hypothetical protein
MGFFDQESRGVFFLFDMRFPFAVWLRWPIRLPLWNGLVDGYFLSERMKRLQLEIGQDARKRAMCPTERWIVQLLFRTRSANASVAANIWSP